MKFVFGSCQHNSVFFLCRFANKSDLPEALSAADVGKEMDLDDLLKLTRHTVIPCVAKPAAMEGNVDPRIHEGLNWLMETIKNDLQSLEIRRQEEKAQQTAEREEERRKTLERIKASANTDANATKDTSDAAAASSISSESASASGASADVILCKSCNVAPAVRRCAASKWEAVCNSCAERMEAAAAAAKSGGDPSADAVEAAQVVNTADASQSIRSIDTQGLPPVTPSKVLVSSRRSLATPQQPLPGRLVETSEQEGDNSVSKELFAPSSETQDVKVAAETGENGQTAKKNGQGDNNDDEEDQGLVFKPKEAPKPAPASDVVLCALCNKAPAERRCAAAGWKPVCMPCGDDVEESTGAKKKLQGNVLDSVATALAKVMVVEEEEEDEGSEMPESQVEQVSAVEGTPSKSSLPMIPGADFHTEKSNSESAPAFNAYANNDVTNSPPAKSNQFSLPPLVSSTPSNPQLFNPSTPAQEKEILPSPAKKLFNTLPMGDYPISYEDEDEDEEIEGPDDF